MPESQLEVIAVGDGDEENVDVPATSSNHIALPHPSWSEYFKKIGENRQSVGMFYAVCKLCLGRRSISCSYGSACNLKRHIEVSDAYFVQIKKIVQLLKTFLCLQTKYHFSTCTDRWCWKK